MQSLKIIKRVFSFEKKNRKSQIKIKKKTKKNCSKHGESELDEWNVAQGQP